MMQWQFLLALLCNNNKSLTRIKYTVAAREDSRGQDLMRFTTNMTFLYTSCSLHFMSYIPFCCNATKMINLTKLLMLDQLPLLLSASKQH